MAHENEAVEEATLAAIATKNTLYDPAGFRSPKHAVGDEAAIEYRASQHYVDSCARLAREVTRLRASAPKVWDAGNIHEAPDNNVTEYRPGILNKQGEFIAWTSRLLTKARALEFLEGQQEEGFGAIFHGPYAFPQPPAGGGA